MTIDDLKQTHHLQADLDGLSRSNVAKFDVNRVWPVSSIPFVEWLFIVAAALFDLGRDDSVLINDRLKLRKYGRRLLIVDRERE